jgi:hypothetical protein
MLANKTFVVDNVVGVKFVFHQDSTFEVLTPLNSGEGNYEITGPDTLKLTASFHEMFYEKASVAEEVAEKFAEKLCSGGIRKFIMDKETSTLTLLTTADEFVCVLRQVNVAN